MTGLSLSDIISVIRSIGVFILLLHIRMRVPRVEHTQRSGTFLFSAKEEVGAALELRWPAFPGVNYVNSSSVATSPESP